MEFGFSLGLLVVTIAALVGGAIAKLLKFQPLLGYIVAGVALSMFFPGTKFGVEKLNELGAILLLFSIGLTLSWSELGKNVKKIVLGSLAQIFVVTALLFLILPAFGFSAVQSIVLAMGFSLSSTAVVVKILSDRAENTTIHGRLMIGWLLVQDLAVVPMMVLLPVLSKPFSTAILGEVGISLFKAAVLVIMAVLLGKHIVPNVIHRVAKLNSRELLLLTSVGLAVGTAYSVSLFGISAGLGAFLAGLVISESQENHAVFAETRPLRDLFVALFFVSLGLSVNIFYILDKLGLVFLLTGLILLLKFFVILVDLIMLKFKGKTLLSVSLGLSQVGEFAFVIFAVAVGLGILTPESASIGVFSGLLTLVATPFIFNSIVPIWRKLKKYKLFSSFEQNKTKDLDLSNHIIICGYGRVGGWVGKALGEHEIPFLVVEYDQKVVNDLKEKGISVVYGDPSEPEILDSAGLKQSKMVVVAIPDRLAQESLIAYIQTVAPNVKIISRVHLDEDWDKLKYLRVDKLVQPEFEAATEIIRSILRSMGKDTEKIKASIKNLRLSHAKI